MPIDQKFSILVPLAKELGYKDTKEMKDALGKEEAGRGEKKGLGFGNVGGAGGIGTGFLGGREIGGGFGVGVKKRLAKGLSVKESVSGGFKDFAQTFTRENIKRRSLEKMFGGPGFISAFARGKLKKKYGTGDKSPSKETDGEEEVQTKSKGDSQAYFSILAKSSLVIPGMARDMNVLRQNIQRLVKLKAGPQEKGKKAYATAADFTKREKSQMSGKQLSDAERERKKDTDYFAEQDKIEAEQEAAKQKKETPVVAAPAPEKKEEEGSFLDTLIGLLKDGLIRGLKKLFNPKALMKVLGKLARFAGPVGLIITAVGGLFSGITAAWDKWKESGSLFEAYKSFLGGIVNFLTFGLLGEEEVNKVFDAIGSFLEPLIEGMKGIYYTVKDWIVNNVGIPKMNFKLFSTPAYYPFKSNPSSEEPEYSKREAPKAKESKPEDQKTKDLSKSEAATPSPSPSPAQKEEPKSATKENGAKLNLPSGVTADAKGFSYKGISFQANDQKELDTAVKAIDDKSVVEYQGTDEKGQPVTKTFNGATGEVSISPPKQSPTAAPAAPAAPAAASGGSASGEASPEGGGVPSSPSPETSASPPSSGSELSDSSSQIAEAQRMESAADMGSSVDASTTNNSSGSTGKPPSKIADVYDTEFAQLYAMA